jgi:hypothetical protein
MRQVLHQHPPCVYLIKTTIKSYFIHEAFYSSVQPIHCGLSWNMLFVIHTLTFIQIWSFCYLVDFLRVGHICISISWSSEGKKYICRPLWFCLSRVITLIVIIIRKVIKNNIKLISVKRALQLQAHYEQDMSVGHLANMQYPFCLSSLSGLKVNAWTYRLYLVLLWFLF